MDILLVCMSRHHMYTGLAEAEKSIGSPGAGDINGFEPLCELNLWPLEERPVLLTAVPSP